MATYPRLNRAALRAMVRELTAVHSTDIISDARINDLLNKRMFDIVSVGDNTRLFLMASLPAPIVIGIYRFPSWEWDNTTKFPGANPSGDNVYMSLDSDTPPWSYGQHDSCLAYGAAADVLMSINDDSTRVKDFSNKFVETANLIIRDDYISHNVNLAYQAFSNPDDAIVGAALRVLALALVGDVLSVETDLQKVVSSTIDVYSERRQLYSAFNWPALMTETFASFAPHTEIFAYGAAAKFAARMNMPQQVVDTLNMQYNTRKDALLREKLYNASGYIYLYQYGQAVAQVRALLQDFTRELSDTLIYGWLNDAWQSFSNERNWSFNTSELTITFPPGINSISLLGSPYLAYQRILNVYEVKLTDTKPATATSAEIVYPVPHIMDNVADGSKLRYDINAGSLRIAPTPTEYTYLRVRYIQEPELVVGNPAQVVMIPANYSMILAYRAAVIGSEWSEYGKKMAPTYQKAADEIFETMVREYQLDHSTEPLQLGGSGLETRKYLPWFRPA
jgi:hypothetical protein